MSSRELTDRLEASALVHRVRGALGGGEGAWIVGGAIRDAALDREVTDLDVAVSGDPAEAARTIAREAGGHAFDAELHGWHYLLRQAGQGPETSEEQDA